MTAKPHVGLMITCLVEQFRPEVAAASVRLLRKAGCRVSIPKTQTCCGQPGFNSGAKDQAIAVAKHSLKVFAGFDYVVIPSGSCTGMVSKHYVTLFPKDHALHQQARDLASRTFELSQFLHTIVNAAPDTTLTGSITYHDSCSSMRELGVSKEPRSLLNSIQGLDLREANGRESCCGFGGSFCIKYGAISAKMADDRLKAFEETGAETAVGPDLGCLLHLAGRASRQDSGLKLRHLAEILDGQLNEAPMGGVSHD